jgi:hypothetical protein
VDAREKKRPRVGVGPPGERKEEVEVFGSSAVRKSKWFATGVPGTKSRRIIGLRFSRLRGGDEECHSRAEIVTTIVLRVSGMPGRAGEARS